MVGRGSFTESFPLFGYSLADYDELFAEKLDLLLKLREDQPVTWHGKFQAPLDNVQVYPRQEGRPLPIWVAVGSTPNSVIRAGTLGLPMALAIIGGRQRFTRSSSSTARPSSTAIMTRVRHWRFIATAMSSPTSARHERSSCRPIARRSPRSARSVAGPRCRMRLSRI